MAQTVVNAGTGIGVLVSGPAAALLVDRWRLAWALFAVVAAVVTVWVARVVPAGGQTAIDNGAESWARTQGSPTLLLAAFLMGLASTAVWTFGQEVVSTSRRQDWLAPAVWTVIGAAGIAGAFSGWVVNRLGVRGSAAVALAGAGLTPSIGLGSCRA